MMKKIRVKNYTNPNKESHITLNKQYSVFISSEHKYYFPSELKANNFLIAISRLFNSLLIELNFYYSELFKEYRNIWLYIENAQEYSMLINDIEIKFNVLFNNKNSENYNYYVFKDLQHLILLLNQLAENLSNINFDTKIYISQNRIKFMIQKINEIHTKLNTLKV